MADGVKVTVRDKEFRKALARIKIYKGRAIRDTANRFIFSVLLKSRARVKKLAPIKAHIRSIYGPKIPRSRAKVRKLRGAAREVAGRSRNNPFKIFNASRRGLPLTQNEVFDRVRSMVGKKYSSPVYTAATFNSALSKYQKEMNPEKPIRITEAPRFKKGHSKGNPARKRDENKKRVTADAVFQAVHFWGPNRNAVDPRIRRIIDIQVQRERAATVKYGERQMRKALKKAGFNAT